MHRVTGLFGKHGLVGGVRVARAECEGCPENIGPERLRRLRKKDLVTRECADNDSLRRRALHRVARWKRRDSRAVPESGLDGAANHVITDEGASGVVNHHDVCSTAHPLERPRDGILAPLSTFHYCHARSERGEVGGRIGGNLRRNGDDNLVNGVAVRKHAHAAIENRPATEREQLFRQCRAKTRAAAAGGNDRGNVHA